jgi:hypothetical protein
MAFNNVTFFELHLDDARFGGIGSPDGSEDEASEGEYEGEDYEQEHVETVSEESRSGVGIGRAVVVLGLFALSAALARQLAGRRGGDEEPEVEMHLDEEAEAAGEPVEVVD